MNTRKQGIKRIAVTFFCLLFSVGAMAQAYSSGGGSATGYKSTLGNQNTASGNYSFAAGWGSQASGQTSFALGYYSKADGLNSMAMGMYAHSQNAYGITIGRGLSSIKPLSNTTSGIMLGMYSNVPTLYISPSNGENRTGKVAIGNVTSPSAKLHIAGDGVENADILLASTGSNKSIIQFRNSSNNITVGSDNVMKFNAPNMQFYPTGQVAVNGAFKATGKVTLSGLAGSSSKVLTVGANGQLSSVEYSTFYDDLGNHTAEQNINLNGKKIVNGTSGLGGIFVSTDGKVGINTENITTAYALAVDGGLITTKVHIQDVNDWQDRVFDADYALMPLGKVEAYVAANRHLPGVPSEAEVKAEGFDLTAMTSALLGKVEELTLYTIRQQREIDSLRDLVTVRFGYDACGNRISRTLEFSRIDGEGKGGEQWQAELHDTFAGTDIMLFPNPTQGRFCLSLIGEASTSDVKAVLSTATGVVLEERKVSNPQEEFDLGSCPAGIYLLHLVSGDTARTWKIIKRN